jgi:D-glycero-D-manno-heptose 1,7-bisphosphate phosphatase
MNKAIFIDKDGTLIEDIPYNVQPDLIRFTEGAIEGLQQLKRKGYVLIVVSNQSGVAHGYFGEKDLTAVQERMQEMLRPGGVQIDAFYFCPHHPRGRREAYAKVCQCRKPKPGMILQGASAYNVDLLRSWLIGDILNDVEAGNAAGCKTILVNNGNETEWMVSEKRTPTAIVGNFTEAVDIITHEFELV